MSVAVAKALVRWLRNHGRPAEQQILTCAICGTNLAATTITCPVCMLRGALRENSTAIDQLFIIQSELAQMIGRKLTAALSLEQRRRSDPKPRPKLDVYGLFRQGENG